MTRPPPALALAALLGGVLGLLAVTPASGELPVGEEAPPLLAIAALRGALPTPQSLWGRVVLLEFFSTTCPHCQAEVPRLNALHRRFRARGLRVLAVSHEPFAAVEEFARAHRVEYDLVLASADVLRDHDVASFPRVVLLDAAGRIRWRGHPEALADAEVERALARGGLRPAFPASWNWVEEELARGSLQGLRARLETLAAAPPSAAAAASARALSAWLGWLLDAWREGAEADEAEGRTFDAWRGWRRLARAEEGSPAGAQAAERAARLEGDPAARREIDAGEAFLAARAGRPGTPDRASLEAFRAIVARAPRTRAAARAAPFVADLEKALAPARR